MLCLLDFAKSRLYFLDFAALNKKISRSFPHSTPADKAALSPLFAGSSLLSPLFTGSAFFLLEGGPPGAPNEHVFIVRRVIQAPGVREKGAITS